jgi:hypothetical protein
MRTTLSLDDNGAVLLGNLRKAQGLSLKQAVNMALPTGLRVDYTKSAANELWDRRLTLVDV